MRRREVWKSAARRYTGAMRLTDLNPNWYGAGGEGITKADGSPSPARYGVGVSFDCPCGCDDRCYIPVDPPLDGGEPVEKGWARTGDTFEDLTLKPSIQRVGGCKWHGFIEDGGVRTA